MAQLESGAERDNAVQVDDGSPKYMPSTEDSDPIVRALKTVLKCKEVTGVLMHMYIHPTVWISRITNTSFMDSRTVVGDPSALRPMFACNKLAVRRGCVLMVLHATVT